MIDPESVKDLFDYKDGVLYWKPRRVGEFRSVRAFKIWNARFCGKAAGSCDKLGYLTIGVTKQGKEKRYGAHRLVWAWHYGVWPKEHIDHIDHDKKNNRIENLRDVTRVENLRNASLRSNNKSGVPGVGWRAKTKKWSVTIGSRYLGEYQTFEEAVSMRKEAEKAHGYHANHGKGDT
jgi:hypothetical protein